MDNRLAVADSETMSIQGVEDAFQTLAGLDAGTLLVNTDGVVISGSAAEANQAAAARQIAAAHADSWQLFINAPMPARFGAVKLPDGTVLASGDIASEDARTALVETFRDGDPDRRIVDRMAVRADGVSEVWAAKALKGAEVLAGLDWGSISLDGPKSYLAGMADPNDVGKISDSLGNDFTVELTPRPSDLTTRPNSGAGAGIEGSQIANPRPERSGSETSGRSQRCRIPVG